MIVIVNSRILKATGIKWLYKFWYIIFSIVPLKSIVIQQWIICFLWCGLFVHKYTFERNNRFSSRGNECSKENSTFLREIHKSEKSKLLPNYAKAVYSANVNLFWKIDDYQWVTPLHLVLSNIFCMKMEWDVASLLKPKLYKRYVDNIFSKHIKSQTDKLFSRLINNCLRDIFDNVK